MNETSAQEGAAVEHQSPEAVFGLLGDDTRVAILRAMGETPDRPVAFGELRERTGVRDSGQFNYHLGKLRGTFVRKTDDGYELTHAGRQIVGAMYAGTYTASATIDPITVEESCPLCGDDIRITYADEVVAMTCTGCEDWRNEFSFPPGGLDQFAREELPAAFDRWMSHLFGGIVAGFCQTCTGRMVGRLVVDDEADRVAGMPAHVEYDCGRCGSTARASGATPALFHPGVRGFFYDHGFDPSTTPSWLLGRIALPTGELLAADPPRLAATFAHDGERVTAVVDADARVTDVERGPADA